MFEQLSDHYLKTALDQVASREGFTERIAWWLISPHGAERWLQFELAFELQRLYGERFAVLCEHRDGSGTASDIVLIARETAKEPIWKNRAAAVIELKLSGSWYFKPDTVRAIQSDVAKVDKLEDVPAIAVVCCLTVSPGPATPAGIRSPYSWIRESLATNLGVDGFQDHGEQLCVNGVAYTAVCSMDLAIPGFDVAQLSLLVHRNRAATAVA